LRNETVSGGAAGSGGAVRCTLAMTLLVLFAAIVGVSWLGWDGALTRRTDPATEDAYVDGDRTPLSAQVVGYVRAIPVGDNQTVRKGDTIAEIDDGDYRAALAQATAQADAARAASAALENKRAVLEEQIVQAQDGVAAAAAQITHAFNEVRRQQLLLPTAAGLLQSLQSAQADLRHQEGLRAQAVAQVGANQKQIDLLNAQVVQARAQVNEADAAVALGRIALSHTRITAPIDGTLGTRNVREGALLGPGTQVDTLTPLDTLWVTANFTERQFTHIRAGQRARVRVDAFRSTPISGEVIGFQPATGSQFSLVPADNSTGNFTKIVQRIPVKIALDLAASRLVGLLRPGMSARVEITTDAPVREAAR
jgi:membrane fusion protein (multidrug efflux system)